ncbi:MFS transporter [Roseomonas sp. BN140053]|uniref:MFS transporter n=1 Tax=Roseomonas sp. BN140053 TaxID=3391898 RepID=UPI0039E8A865
MPGLGGGFGRALSSRNARIYFGASLGAWTGWWMHRIAVGWLAWELTRSPFWVGLVSLSDLVPAVLVGPVAGAVADRVDRVRLASLGQLVNAAEALGVAVLTALGQIDIGLLIALELVSSTAASFVQPARQSILPALVSRADLPAAVACNSFMFNVARFLGPSVAGPLIAGFGVVPAILCNALAALIATLTMPLLRLDPDQRRGHAATRSLLAETAEGLLYVARHPGLGPIFAFAAMACLTLRGVQELLPPFVEHLFNRGAESLAVLTAAFGVGALVAGLRIAARGRLEGTTRIAIGAVLAQAVFTAGFALTSWFPLAVACAVCIGAAASSHGIATQTLAQTAADASMRGRVLALWSLVSRAFPACGALVLGATGEAFGLRLPTLVLAGLACLGVAWGLSRARVIADSLEPPRA